MARIIKDFDKVSMGDFVAFDRGYHLLTITGHKEDIKNAKDVDIFEVVSDTGATTNFTLYFQDNCMWCYKKLLHSCGAKVDKMTGTQSLDMSKLIGKRFGAFVELEEVDKWDEAKGQTVTRRYPRINAGKIFTEEKTIELMEKAVNETVANSKNDLGNWGSKGNEEMTPVEDGFVPF